VLLMFEQSGQPHEATKGMFLEAMFEVASALGTVGLSTGLTASLTTAGKIVIIGLMFLGRLGPISVFVALSGKEKEVPVQYPNEEPMIG
jgi:trk system potassium uptake protein